MNKDALVKAVAEATGLTQRDSRATVDATLDAIADALAQGEKVTLVGFGAFEVHARKARQGRNPQTGTAVRIAARKAPAFRAGKPLRDVVDG